MLPIEALSKAEVVALWRAVTAPEIKRGGLARHGWRLTAPYPVQLVQHGNVYVLDPQQPADQQHVWYVRDSPRVKSFGWEFPYEKPTGVVDKNERDLASMAFMMGLHLTMGVVEDISYHGVTSQRTFGRVLQRILDFKFRS